MVLFNYKDKNKCEYGTKNINIYYKINYFFFFSNRKKIKVFNINK